MHTDNYYSQSVRQLKRIFEKPKITAKIRTEPQDFRVDEQLSFQPSGSGEHLFLQIEKANANTDWVAKQLQKTFSLTSRELGYAGKKDRHSIATQWFSLHLPGKEIDLAKLNSINMVGGELKVVKAIRHNKKLKTGSLVGNKFEVVLRCLSGKIDQQRIDSIKMRGVPNYFGYQRFGFNANNLNLADQYLNQKIQIKNRNKRGLIISSARSFLFNLMLSKRIDNKTWCRVVSGDCLMLDACQSYFKMDESTHGNEEEQQQQQQQRIDSGDIHVSGLLPGRQPSDASFSAKEIEDQIINEFPKWMKAFLRLNLTTSRRAFRCLPRDLIVKQEADNATLKFSLSKGCYATSVIRELVDATDASLNPH